MRQLLSGPARAAEASLGPIPNEAYRWRPVAVGGGGFVTGIAMDRSATTILARSDVYGGYRWDRDANRWQQIVTADTMPAAYHVQAGLAEGVYALAVAPGDARRAYMAMAGRIFRSDDSGKTWSDAALPGQSPLKFDPNSKFRTYGPFLAVSPTNADLLFLGTPEAGLWRSRDGGGTWHRVTSVPEAKDLRPTEGIQTPGIAIWFAPAPARQGTVLVASPGNGLFRGDAHTDAFAPLAGGPHTIKRIAFAPDGGLYAVDAEAKALWGFHKGAWNALAVQDEATKRSWADVMVSGRQGAVIAVDEGGRFLCSADRGMTWTSVKRSFLPGEGEPPWLRLINRSFVAVGQILGDPAHPRRVWAATGVGVYTAEFGDDCAGEVEFRSQTRGIEEIVANDAIKPPGGDPLFAGWDFGIHRKPDLDAFSETYGPKPRVLISAQQMDWSPSNPEFIVTNASDALIGCCAEDGDSVLAGYSLDGGRNWQKFPTLPTPPGTKPDDPWRMSFGTIAVAADDTENIVWAPAFNRAPFVTRDRGRTWAQVHFPGEKAPNTGSFGGFYPQRKTLTTDRVLPGTFYLVHSGDEPNSSLAGLWRSRDGGTNWERVFLGEIAPASPWAAKLRAVPGHAGNLFFTSGVRMKGDTALRRSTDGGASWTIVKDIDQVDDIGFGKPASGARYPTIFVSGRHRGIFGVWRSVDEGVHWQQVGTFPLGSLDQVTVVTGDPDHFGRVYLGFKGSGWAYGEPRPCQPVSAPSAGCTVVAAESQR